MMIPRVDQVSLCKCLPLAVNAIELFFFPILRQIAPTMKLTTAVAATNQIPYLFSAIQPDRSNAELLCK